MSTELSRERILGLDIGVSSVGWALTEFEDGDPVRIVDLGSRVFEAGVEGDVESGKDESRTVARRDARLQRRQTERRARRHRKLALLLQRHGLLPEGDLASEAGRHATLNALDKALFSKYAASEEQEALNQLPYFLRARALDHPLVPHELGRALYHLGQRRGFLSNRKAPKDKDEEGVVKKAIGELSAEMETAGSRTLGEHLCGFDPHSQRVRRRWTARQMYVDEFEAIWQAQSAHHPGLLTDELKKVVSKAIFHQRPLKSQKGLIGKCELEFGRKRAPMALLESQRFRMLQKVNDLLVIAPDYSKRTLTPEERAIVLDQLDQHRQIKFTTLRKELKLKKGFTFNLEEGGEDRLKGNDTAAQLRKVFDGHWDALSAADRDRVVDDLRSIQKDEVLYRRGMEVWGLDEEAAKAFSRVTLDDGHCALSSQAIRKLLPLMETGVQFATARKDVYGGQGSTGVADLLPRVEEAPIELRNPAVQRVLTELRKVVNAVLERHGKPDLIRIELARDLKKSRKQRTDTWRKNRKNQKSREAAATRIEKEAGIPKPKRDDVLRVLLAEESNWECPYTGKPISMGSLVGDASQFDIEHIIPYSRCLDDSYMNKTLCYHEENRSVKRNKTPHEAYAHDEERWEEIVERVKRFRGEDGVKRGKLRRFMMTSLEDFESFTSRQLNDTRYASTLAAKYLGLLYGGVIDTHGVRRVQATQGQTTADLRNAWDLNRILGDGGSKSRDDHRHHAVDAVAIALTSPKTIKSLSTANEKAGREGRRRWWKDVPSPWDGFQKDVQDAIANVVVSHRVSRKVNGPLHEQTLYSRQFIDEKGKPCVHVRKLVDALSVNEVKAIVDPHVRAAVEAKLSELGGDPKKAFTKKENHPSLTTRDGRSLPVHKVRIRKSLSTFTVGKGPRRRQVVPASNHHMEILEVTDKRGNVKWEDIIVDQYTALQRLRRREPIVQRDHGEGKRFVMSLAPGDLLELDGEQETRELCVLRSISKNDFMYARVNDARTKKDIMASGDWGRASLAKLRGRLAQKMVITSLGEVRRAND
jgi:CRISPR-associated endonuclease Csn1